MMITIEGLIIAYALVHVAFALYVWWDWNR